MSHENPVLIVEDSPAIGMLLKSYLEKLGYSQIHICETGATAITTFSNLLSKNMQPIVLLDYMLPDMDARSILTQMLEMLPTVKVILETASSKDEDSIKDLIRLGIYHYLEKPIRFEDLKNIITILKEEESILNEGSSQKSEVDDDYKLIDHQFNTYKRASIARLIDQSKFSEKNILEYIKKLELAGNIIALDKIREISCNSCGSLKFAQLFQCPSCKVSKFEQIKLIEHFDCGNFSEDSTYVDDKCPKCKKQIKALGVDYRILSNRYLCQNCGEVFQDVYTSFLCLKCNNTFKVDDGKWKESMEYKLVKDY
ncbi:MAG: response regulator [Nitrosopumilus sp.]